jgi:hypothetical protein
MLGGQRVAGLVTHFHFDKSGSRSFATYSPDHVQLTKLLGEMWNPAGINLLGFVHSHPGRYSHPSPGDLVYAERILEAIPDLERLLLPIVIVGPEPEFHPFAAVRGHQGVECVKLAMEIVEPAETGGASETATSALQSRRRGRGRPHGSEKASAPEHSTAEPAIEPTRSESPSVGATFARVEGTYSLPRLARSRIIYVGAGGAASFIEDLTRAGVGEHVLIDPDIVSETNLATQQVYRRDLGRPKVDCVAERVLDVNPAALVKTLSCALDDLSDAAIGLLAREPLGSAPVPEVILLCGLTDDFYAQARVNRLALQFGLPSLSAQVYEAGRGAEITFTYPGVTPACQRCALSGRYREYLERGYQNIVTSHGTPIFATQRLNSLKGFIAMALLHHGTDHPRWGGLLSRIGNRNLVQIRMDPDLALPIFDRVFGPGDRERILFDEAVWLPQKPDCPANGFPSCPDCGGTGDLRNSIGKFTDTRLLPQGR